MQHFVSEEVNLSSIKSKLEDDKFTGLESNLINTNSSLVDDGDSHLSKQL